MLLCKQSLTPACFEAARIEHCGEFASPTRHGRDLFDPIAEEPREWDVEGSPVDLARIPEHIREVDVRVAENKFIRKARTENVR